MRLKDQWTPESVIIGMLLGTACLVLIMIEASIVTRAGLDDVKESRALLKEVLMLIISLTAGFFMGKNKKDNNDDNKDKQN